MAKNGGVVNMTFIPAFVSAATAAWGKGLESSIWNAKTNSAMEKMEKDYFPELFAELIRLSIWSFCTD